MNLIEHIDKELFNDKEFMKKLIKKKGSNLQYASDELRNDEELVKLAIINDSSSFMNFINFKYAGSKLKNDKEFVKNIICNSQSGLITYYLDDELRNDKEIVFELIKIDPSYIEDVNYELLNDIEFVKEYFIIAKKTLRENTDDRCINEFLEYINDKIKNNQEFGIWYYNNIVLGE
jgi:hypothetical protein